MPRTAVRRVMREPLTSSTGDGLIAVEDVGYRPPLASLTPVHDHVLPNVGDGGASGRLHGERVAAAAVRQIARRPRDSGLELDAAHAGVHEPLEHPADVLTTLRRGLIRRQQHGVAGVEGVDQRLAVAGAGGAHELLVESPDGRRRRLESAAALPNRLRLRGPLGRSARALLRHGDPPSGGGRIEVARPPLRSAPVDFSDEQARVCSLPLHLSSERGRQSPLASTRSTRSSWSRVPRARSRSPPARAKSPPGFTMGLLSRMMASTVAPVICRRASVSSVLPTARLSGLTATASMLSASLPRRSAVSKKSTTVGLKMR